MLYYQIIDNYPEESPALIFEDRTLSYGQLKERVTAWAGALQQQGIGKGDKVGLLSKNCADFVAAYMAIIKAGGVVVPFNFQLAAPEIAYIAQDAAMKLLITAAPLDLKEALAKTGNTGLRQLTYAELGEGRADAYSPVPMEEEDNCTIIYTSGTTGRPKGAMLSHKNLVANARDFTLVVDMRQGDKAMCVLPMYHCFAWTVSVTSPLYKGGCVVIQESYNLGTVVNCIENYKIDQFAGVPTMLQMFFEGSAAERFRSLRFFISGGASLPQKLAKDFQEKFGKPVQEGYGLSEASPVCTVNPPDKIKVGSIGPALPNVSLEIRDEADKPVATGIVGELCAKGDNVMLGYLNRPKETAEALRGGWLHTGDLAYMDEEGYVFIVDRLKDMVITGGENVYPREVEEILYTHPAIKEAAVIGVPDKLRGQAVAAYVVLKPGEEATKPQLRRFMLGQVANYKVPKYFTFMEQLPKNNTGKILKTALRELAIEDRVHRL